MTLKSSPLTDSQPSKRPSQNDIRSVTADGSDTSTAAKPKNASYRMVILDSDEDEELDGRKPDYEDTRSKNTSKDREEGEEGEEEEEEEEQEDEDEDEDGEEQEQEHGGDGDQLRDEQFLLEADPHDPMKLPGEWQISEGALSYCSVYEYTTDEISCDRGMAPFRGYTGILKRKAVFPPPVSP